MMTTMAYHLAEGLIHNMALQNMVSKADTAR